MDNVGLSDYAVERFGNVASIVQNAIIETVHEAQEAALRVHVEHGLPERDPYGTSFRGHLNRRLLAKLNGVPGIVARKPAGHHARYDLPIIPETGVALYWWRVPGDGKTSLVEAKLQKTSELQAHLMSLTPTATEPQMTIDHAAMTDEELEEHFSEDDQFSIQMAQAEGRTVTLWVSASPDGLFDFGWGDAELVDADTGELAWPRWESLKNAVPVAPSLGVVGSNKNTAARFDSDAEQDSGFGLSVRAPGEVVSSEERPEEHATNRGSDES